MNEPDDQQDQIDSVAADWAVRLGAGPLSDAERSALDGWLAESPAYAAAFDEACSAWAKMDALREAPGDLLGDGASKVSSAPRRARISRRRSRRFYRVSWVRAGALAASLVLAVGIGRFWLGDPRILLLADYRTAPGERSVVTLPDSSTVELGPASAVDLHYGDGERRIELLTGLAYFAPTPADGAEYRPFVVETANGSARALGTEFMVRRVGEAVEVVVAEHDVEVTLDSNAQRDASVIVSPGRAVRYDGTGLGAVGPVDLDRVLAWRRDRLIFDRAPLGDVVAELNRYRHGRIVIAGTALASRRVSGVFDMSRPDAALAAVVRELDITAVSLPPLVTVLY